MNQFKSKQSSILLLLHKQQQQRNQSTYRFVDTPHTNNSINNSHSHSSSSSSNNNNNNSHDDDDDDDNNNDDEYIHINMKLVTINAPFCLRKDVDDASEGEGFFFVNNGILVFRDDTMMFYIYEGETFRNGGYNSIPVLHINLRTVASIKFKKTYSTGLNFEGGMMTITGVFDRESEEIVTIKMNRTDYKLLATVLKEMDL